MNVPDLLERLNIAYITSGHRHCTNGWFQTECPLCSPNSGKFRLGIHKSGRGASCWTCGRISMYTVIKEYTNLTHDAIKAILADMSAIPDIDEPKPKGTLKLPEGVGPLLKAHKRYLRKRGYNPREVEKLWDVRGLGIAGNLSWRILIPIIHRGETVSWTTRSIVEDDPLRYLTAKPAEEKMPGKELLYGEDYCRSAVIVCEGPFDVWSVGPGAVCTFGTGFKRSQVLKLAKYPVRAVCYDGEPAAQKKAQELCDLLEPFDGETYNVVLDTKDPGEASRKDIKKIRKVVFGQ